MAQAGVSLLVKASASDAGTRMHRQSKEAHLGRGTGHGRYMDLNNTQMPR